jgi:hypothetical protein
MKRGREYTPQQGGREDGRSLFRRDLYAFTPFVGSRHALRFTPDDDHDGGQDTGMSSVKAVVIHA